MISLLVKILTSFLGLIVISKTYLDYKKRHESLMMMLFWTIMWLIIVVIALKPILVMNIIKWSGNKRIGIGTFLGMFSMFLFYITYRIYNKTNRLEQKVRDMVTKLAVKDIDK